MPYKNREDRLRYAQKYYRGNKESMIAQNMSYQRANPKRQKCYDLKMKYGITCDDYDAMFKKQKGCCAICGVHQSELKRALRVDHNHETGKVRGLLCHNCNVGAGHFRDDPALLRKAAKFMNGRK